MISVIDEVHELLAIILVVVGGSLSLSAAMVAWGYKRGGALIEQLTDEIRSEIKITKEYMNQTNQRLSRLEAIIDITHFSRSSDMPPELPKTKIFPEE